jgi:flavin reductase (DIM6/NTAB) family NADH-FMN oxidoreductase RutF
MSVSLDPVLFLASLSLDSQMDGWLRASGAFALNILPWREQFLADQFAGQAPLAAVTFAGVEHTTSETGAPILLASIAWADCRIVDAFVTGDHRCFVGEAVAMGEGKGDAAQPLVRYSNRYRSLA